MKKIYVADDDPTISHLLRLCLEKLPDTEASFFDNGLDLYRAVQQSIPDAIVTDIILPGLDGLAIVRLLKFDEKYKSIPALVISSIIDPEIEEQVNMVRADGFMRKPFRSNDIREKVSRLLRIPEDQ